MILRRLSRSARRQDWFAVALELVVVVAGIFLGLQVTEWNEARQDREREAAYLRQLAADLEATERSLLSIAEFHLDGALASARVSQAFWKPSPPRMEALLDDLGAPIRSQRERPVMGTIDALIATGDLRLIRSDALRAELVAYAEFSEAKVENIQRHDETYYRPGVRGLAGALDVRQLLHERDRVEGPDPDREPALVGLPEGERRVPFPRTLEELLADRDLYTAYNHLLVAHRNQGFNYLLILERARRLLGQVHRELYGTLDPGNCQLAGHDGRFTGSCGPHALSEGRELDLELSEAGPVTGGARSPHSDPSRVFTGRSDLGPDEGAEVAVEVDLRGRGLIRTAAGRFRVSGLILSDDGERLSFRIEGDREVAPGAPATR